MIKKALGWYNRPQSSFMRQFGSLIIILVVAFVIRTFGYGLYQVPTGSMETTLLTGERFFADKFTPFFQPFKRGEIIAFNAPTYKYSDNPLVNLWQRYVYGPENWTKRVIGIPGDHVQGFIEDGRPVVHLNGTKLDEPYLNKYPIIAVYKDSKASSEIELKQGNRDWHYVTVDPNVGLDKQVFYNIDPEKIVRMGDKIFARYPSTPLPDSEDIFDVHLGDNEYWVMGDNRLGSWDSRGWGKLDGKLIHAKIKYRIWSIDDRNSWWVVDLLRHPIEFWKRIRWSRCLQAVS
jgi:signal peptidase I